jgi:hypothetical protein
VRGATLTDAKMDGAKLDGTKLDGAQGVPPDLLPPPEPNESAAG